MTAFYVQLWFSHTQEAKVIALIYDTYLTGTPLAGIVEMLHQANIPSSSGKEYWSTTMLHQTLSDSRYIPLIGFEKYVAAQFELDKRANYDQDTGNRKTARYHSQNVLSGLLFARNAEGTTGGYSGLPVKWSALRQSCGTRQPDM